MYVTVTQHESNHTFTATLRDVIAPLLSPPVDFRYIANMEKLSPIIISQFSVWTPPLLLNYAQTEHPEKVEQMVADTNDKRC